MTQRYRVLISGRTTTGRPLAELRTGLVQAFGLQGEQLDRMLSGQPLVVSRRAAPDAAERLLARLQALGLEARSEALPDDAAAPPAAHQSPAATDGGELFALAGPSAAPTPDDAQAASAAATPAAEAEMLCPRCGAAQPKRTLCRQCGLDMPRYLAAQATAEQEARARRDAERAAASGAPRGRGNRAAGHTAAAGLLGLGVAGRLGRLDYFAGSLLSTLIWLAFVLLAATTGKPGFAGLGLLLSAIYGLRCLALRLHDTGRTGWLALVALVPILGGLMALALLFLGGEAEENEYGEAAGAGGGRRAFAALFVLLVVGGLSYRSLGQNPEKAMQLLQAMQVYQGTAPADEEDDEPAADLPQAAVRYAGNNRVDIYVIAGCTDCDAMRRWLDGNGLRYTLYSVDSDQHAAERLHSIIAGDGQSSVRLPVLEVNGKVLSGNPPIGDVHRQLRPASPS